MDCAANVTIANDHDHGFETRQGNDAIPRPLDGSENQTEIAIETEMSPEEETAATEIPTATQMTTLVAGEMMVNAMSVSQPDVNSGTKNFGKRSATVNANAKRSVVPESVSESRIGSLTAIENATAGSRMNAIQDPNDPMGAIGLGTVETRIEMSARIQGSELRRKNPPGWIPTSPTNLESVFLVVRPKTGNWMAFKHGN